ncbi:tRNA dimethylallyltransferase mitochondrial [Spathaspora sp. JA1]|nr:tRNA dimethylallyltransferase mitochondrial [Spathaspora sp. JA1]
MTKPKKPIISIVGTTGVGKSQFSIDLAKAINGEIINADSMQVYKKLDIITNKHPIPEREGIPHHVMDHVDWNERYYLHPFRQQAIAAIDDIHSRGKIPIVVGGTHYYLQTLLFNNKTVGDEEELEQENKTELTTAQLEILDGPVDQLFQELQKVDPLIASKFHPQDDRKLRRALEIWYTTGKKPSDLYRQQKYHELEDSSLRYNTLIFWVYCDREVLTPRLDTRVDKMMELGAIEEIKEMYEVYKSKNYTTTSGVWQVIGFKEFLPWLDSNMNNLDLFKQGVETMKVRTRQYAKYQIRWILNVLLIELEKESRFNYKYGGKLYILDATDLTHWQQQVKTRGIEITKQFLQGSTELPQAPQELMHMFNKSKSHTSQKVLHADLNWKHYTCDICKDKSGKPYVMVGKDVYDQHMASKRHRRTIYANKKRQGKLDYQVYLKNNKLSEGEDNP